MCALCVCMSCVTLFTLPHTTLHTQYTTPHYTTLHALHYTTLHYTTPHYTHYTTLHYTTRTTLYALHYTTLHYTTRTTLHYTHYTTLHYTTRTTLHCTTLHYTTLHTLHYTDVTHTLFYYLVDTLTNPTARKPTVTSSSAEPAKVSSNVLYSGHLSKLLKDIIRKPLLIFCSQ